MSYDGLAEALELRRGLTDEEIATALIGALRQSKDDHNPQSRLQALYQAIAQHGAASLLDPLEVVPLLIEENFQAAHDILSLVGECGNAKEVIIATQEAVEQVRTIASLDIVDDDVDLASQLTTLIDLYSSSIPRLRRAKKPPSQMIRFSLSDLESAIRPVIRRYKQMGGREIIIRVTHLIQQVLSWVKAIADVKTDEISSCINILRQLLDKSLTACSQFINSAIAQRTFKECFPRLAMNSALPSGWEDGAEIASVLVDTYKLLDVTSKEALKHPSISSLIYLAHSPEPLPLAQHLSSEMFATILSSMQTNTCLDESISILLKTMTFSIGQNPKPELSSEIVLPLFSVLPSLVSSHPDPDTRHYVFRIMSLTLSLTPSPLRFQMLFDLASNSNVPSIPIAAVALLREAVLDALSQDRQNIFASPLLLQTFGPVIFVSRPSDFLISRHSLKDLQGSQELSRLSECLSLYYILLARDKRNRTGVCDGETMRSVKRGLLGPLRSSLLDWLETIKTENGDSQLMITIASLQVGLERVETVLSTIETGLVLKC